MRHANLIDPDGDRLVVHGTSMFLFVTVAGEDGTLTAGGFTRAQLDELLDAVAPSTGGTATEPHTLTPDAITDEMVERGRSAYWGPTYGSSVEERVRAILTAALTEPPARPEGAERWEDFLIDALDYQALTDQQITDLADRIAEEMNR